jgi:hypothetical protein
MSGPLLSEPTRMRGYQVVMEWACPNVFTLEQCAVIRKWAEQLRDGGADAELSPPWPSEQASTRRTREETARRLFRRVSEP